MSCVLHTEHGFVAASYDFEELLSAIEAKEALGWDPHEFVFDIVDPPKKVGQ